MEIYREDDTAGNQKGQKHPGYIYSDRDADSALATGRDDSGNHQLYDPSDKTVNISSDDVPSELSGFRVDRDFFRNSGNNGGSLRDDCVNTGDSSVDGWWGNLVWHLFWRPLFAGIDKCASDL